MKRSALISLIFIQPLFGAIGCMDNSKHRNRALGYDYKNYHYVQCSCRCDRYAQAFDRGTCSHCAHYRVPQQVSWLPTKS